MNNKNLNFKSWLVGFTDGDGTFKININKTKVIYEYNITQNKNKEQLLHKIKKELKVGKIIKYNNKVSYIIRDKRHIERVIFPIFDKYPLLSHKYYDYIKFKECLLINNDLTLSQKDKLLKIKYISINNMPKDYISPIWNNINYNNIKSINDIKDKISKSWLTGFIEAKGRFIINKDRDRYIHIFSISSLDPIIIYSIKYIFHINAKVKHKEIFNMIETANSRNINNIIRYFIKSNNKNIFYGIKSYEFNLWKKSYLNYRNNNSKLCKIQQSINRFI
uniref:Putative endonuclease n=1 Tax=Candida neerlandica TaxID=148634 RepID=B4Y548_9ASCO|nr:putative endonuclease [Candida neerlandica]ABX89439.1 putative endonuclease [Candida neerlandica]